MPGRNNRVIEGLQWECMYSPLCLLSTRYMKTRLVGLSFLLCGMLAEEFLWTSEQNVCEQPVIAERCLDIDTQLSLHPDV